MTTSSASPSPSNSPAENSSPASFSAASSGDSRRRHWLPRFSLRTALVVMLILGVGLGIGGNFWRKVHRQRRLVSILEEAGGHVQYGYEFGSGPEVDYEFAIGQSGGRFYANPPAGQTEDTSSRIGRYGTPPGPRYMRRIFGDNVYATIEGVNFQLSNAPQPLDVAIWDELPELRLVTLHEDQVNDETVRAVAKLPHLRFLGLDGHRCGLSKDVLRQLRQARRLEGLTLYGAWVTDDTLSAVGEISQLKYFALISAPNVTAKGLESLAGLRELQELRITGTPHIDDASLRHLVQLDGLKSLSLIGTGNVDFNLEQVSRIRTLQSLELWNTIRAQPRLEHLTRLPELRSLNLVHTSIGDSDLGVLSQLPRLQYLSIRGSDITNQGLTTLVGMQQLRGLTLHSDKVTDKGFQKLGEMTNLRMLHLSGDITTGTASILKSQLPGCGMYFINSQGLRISVQP
jgi:hypothetical protein